MALSVILFSACSSFKTKPQESHRQQAIATEDTAYSSIPELDPWQQNLYHSFLEDDDPMVRLSGIAQLIWRPKQQKVLLSKAKKIIENMIVEKEYVQDVRLAVFIKELCRSYQVLACREKSNGINPSKLEPNNLVHYLNQLTGLAHQDKKTLIPSLLDKMAQSLYTDNYLGWNTNKLYDLIYDYTLTNPIPEKIIGPNNVQAYKAHYEQYYKNKCKIDLTQYIHSIHAYHHALTVSLRASNRARLRPLYATCSLKEHTSQCEKIGRIMIDHSKDTATHLFGYSLLDKVFELTNNKEKARKNKIESIRSNQYMQCSHAQNQMEASDKHYLKTYAHELSTGKSESEALRVAQNAFYQYINIQQHEEHNMKRKNCEGIKTMDETLLLKKLHPEDPKLKGLNDITTY